MGVSGDFAAYTWSNNDATSTLDVSTSGMVTVTVENTAGCTGEASLTVTVNELPVAVSYTHLTLPTIYSV